MTASESSPMISSDTPAPVFTDPPQWALGLDPGGSWFGVVLARLDTTGYPIPVDGTTVERDTQGIERDILHTGEPAWVRRCVRATIEMLDMHSVDPDEVEVYVETLLPPTPVWNPKSPKQAEIHSAGPSTTRRKGQAPSNDTRWRGLAGAHALLGWISGTWPDAWLVAPGAAASQDRSDYPASLFGRKPSGWLDSAAVRDHQRSAWWQIKSGMEQKADWEAKHGITRKPVAAAPTASPQTTSAPSDRELAAQALDIVVASGSSRVDDLIEAARTVAPDRTGSKLADLVVMAALLGNPATPVERLLVAVMQRLKVQASA